MIRRQLVAVQGISWIGNAHECDGVARKIIGAHRLMCQLSAFGSINERLPHINLVYTAGCANWALGIIVLRIVFAGSRAYTFRCSHVSKKLIIMLDRMQGVLFG